MKILLSIIISFLPIYVNATKPTPLWGIEFNGVFGGERLVASNKDLGITENLYLNELISIGPNLELVFTPNYSIRMNTLINYNLYGADNDYRSFLRLAMPIDIQGFYSFTPEIKVGAGANIILANSLKERIYNEDYTLQAVNTYKFNNSVAPIFTIMLTDPFNNHAEEYNGFRFIALSYTKHNLSLKDYEPNPLLEETGINGGRFIFTLGMFFKFSNK